MDTGNVYFNKNISNIMLGLANNNSDYEEKIRQIDLNKINTEKKLDSFEKGKEIIDTFYECYPNYQEKEAMPKSVFSDQFGYNMQKEISDYMNDFYDGKNSQEDVQKFFQESCISMLKYRTQQHQTSGDNAMDRQQIVSEMYEIFAKENMRAAKNANYKEGETLNKTYGGRNDDWVYYNSDYHFQCMETKAALQEAVENMTDQWEISAIDTEEVEKNSKMTLDGGFDFNSGWNFTYRNQVGRASMEDERLAPPEEFKFFYKENSFPDEGNLWLSLNGTETSSNVPFSISDTGNLKGQIFNLNNLLDHSLFTENIKKQYGSFLTNFTVFTRWYSLQSKINNIFGNYVPQMR
ncbi:MAG: hypothetical protein PHY47_28670 [Lachnospiraceae bacterium]|nr:hypothetical protein [Lachnospiraceae bacterium]